jgi:dephospho-CoA kinase
MEALHLGLTGGIGSGKSTVAALLAAHGACVIDADAISRATTAPGGAAIGAIREIFGYDMITNDGALDREAMRKRVFSDPTAKLCIEEIIHPLVGQAITAQTQTAQSNGAKCIVFDLPLLVESPRWRQRLDRVLVVDCLPATQIARVVKRSALAEHQILQIMGAQATRNKRLAAADVVLFNDGIDLGSLATQVAELVPQFGL